MKKLTLFAFALSASQLHAQDISKLPECSFEMLESGLIDGVDELRYLREGDKVSEAYIRYDALTNDPYVSVGLDRPWSSFNHDAVDVCLVPRL